ncbi:MAG: DUF3644 domain-containing protein [Methylocystaceae bacterium]|nr:DUF3644 domain-containing protein [Methylocystaceae bacterium]
MSLVKAMLLCGDFKKDQDILAYFTRPSRSINHARISEIKEVIKGGELSVAAQKYVEQPIASNGTLQRFLETWPNIDPKTGLHLDSEELLVKSREAMMAAVQAFNNPTAYFKSENFIVLASIAWVYLLHHFYRNHDFDYVYREEDGTPKLTKHGAERHFDLTACLAMTECPLDEHTVRNLTYLLEIRHEIEHQCTSRIDDAVSAKLQACCLNYNHWVANLFGRQYALDREMSLALQFSGISMDQRKELTRYDDLPGNIRAFNAEFEDGLSDEDYNDPRYAYRVALVQKKVNNRNKADEVVEIVKAGSDDEVEINRILIQDRERQKYRWTEIRDYVHRLGFTRFQQHHHAQLWNDLDAKNPGKGYGVMVATSWFWYDTWLEVVIEHCEEHAVDYRDDVAMEAPTAPRPAPQPA